MPQLPLVSIVVPTCGRNLQLERCLASLARLEYPRDRLEELYGSLDANVMRATLERGKTHERVVATAILGEARARDATAGIARELLDEYPLVREWAKRALTAIAAPHVFGG